MEVSLIQYPALNSNVSARAAAVSTGTKNTDKALQSAMKSGHTSVLEHENYTFEIKGVSRVLLAQLTRHRIASFTVKSQRYVDHSDVAIHMPASIAQDDKARDIYLRTAGAANKAYRDLLEMGIPKEDARYILPQGITTDLIMTMNARELHHFFSLRCCNRAQAEIRELADGMLSLCRQVSPEIFRNAGPTCITEGACHEARSCGHPRTDLVTEETT